MVGAMGGGEQERGGTATGAGGRPFVVGFGGTTRAGSSSERALRACLAAAEAAGAETQLIAAQHLHFPMYDPACERVPEAQAFTEAIRRADGVVIASPGYHGSVSGLLKNALDYVEDLREDERPYLHGRAVGCIACAYGWQATVTTLGALRQIVHALRGWPTPLGVGLNSAHPIFDEAGEIGDPGALTQLDVMATQVVEFAGRMMRAG